MKGSGDVMETAGQAGPFRFDPANDGLARHLAAAGVAYMAGIPFHRAMRLYVQPLPDVGDIWKLCAEIASGSFSADGSGAGLAQLDRDRASVGAAEPGAAKTLPGARR